MPASWTQFVNQHSFLLVGIAGIVILAFVLLRDGVQPNDWIALLAAALGLAAAYGLFQPGASTHSEVERVLAQIGAGRPVLLELQSPY